MIALQLTCISVLYSQDCSETALQNASTHPAGEDWDLTMHHNLANTLTLSENLNLSLKI